MADWTIHSFATTPDQCVSWSLAELSEKPHTVTLLPAASPEVSEAMRAVREQTYARCLTKDEAVALVTASLTELGESGFRVSTEGPFQVPLDREKEVLEHYEAGCWMFSTHGWMDQQFVFFVSGK